MAIIKKMSVASYALALSVVVALVALIVGIVSCSGDGFWVDEMGGVIAFTIVGIVCGAGAVALAVKFGEKPWVSAVVALTVLFFALATCFMIRVRWTSWARSCSPTSKKATSPPRTPAT